MLYLHLYVQYTWGGVLTSCSSDEDNDKSDTTPPTTYTVTVTNGKASPTSAAAGATVTITANAPEEGKEFDKWTTIDGVTFASETSAETTFTMPAKAVCVTATYKTVYIGTKAPTEAKAVGDIVFTDGSATPYSDGLTLTDAQKAAAIAVIFYVGTECSNDSNSRTLGVGLAHNKSGLKWCTDTATAYRKKITTILCLGSGSVDAYSFTGDKDGSDNLEQIAAFDGVTDTATEENYPAFYLAKNYKDQTNSHVSGTSYESGWYLPTICEIFHIWKNKTTVNAALSKSDGTQFGYDGYWSSSQQDSDDRYAYYIDIGTGKWYYNYKYGNSYVCAIREF